MFQHFTIQYQAHTEPVSLAGENITPDKWIYAWADPKRFSIDPRLAIVLAATSGGVISPWALTQPETVSEDRWHQAWSEPVRLKIRLRAEYNQFGLIGYPPQPSSADLIRWYAWLSQPVMPKKGLAARYQQDFTAPPRVIPTANITATMAATETNNDVFLGAINVYDSSGSTTSGAGARVSIVEIKTGGSPFSVQED